MLYFRPRTPGVGNSLTPRLRYPTFDAYIAAFNPLIALRYGVLSGNPNNFGNASPALTITAANITYGGNGVALLGAPSFGYGASNSIVTVNNSGQFNALQVFTTISILTLTSITSGGSRIWQFDGTPNHVLNIGTTGAWDIRIERATTDATLAGAAGDMAGSSLARMVALTFDAAQSEALKVYHCIGGVWTKLSGIVQGSGAVVTMTGSLNFGNNVSGTRVAPGNRARDIWIANNALSESTLQMAAIAAGLMAA